MLARIRLGCLATHSLKNKQHGSFKLDYAQPLACVLWEVFVVPGYTLILRHVPPKPYGKRGRGGARDEGATTQYEACL